MSQTPDNTTHVITSVPENDTKTEENVEKQSLVAKTKNFVKNHKKPAIAVGALVALVGASALAGRKTAPSYEPLAFEFAPVNDDDVAELVALEVIETETA